MPSTLKEHFDRFFQGEIQFSEFMQYDLENNVIRKNIEDRCVYKADATLRRFHSFLSATVIRHLLVANCVFSYRDDTNIADAVRKHAKSRHFYQTDLSNFFESIDASLIEKTILRSKENSDISDLDQFSSRITQLLSFANALPAGFSTSPALSNAALFDFDIAFSKYCERNSLEFSRYSDDIIISGDGRAVVEAGANQVAETLYRVYGERFSLNPHKTRFMHVGRKIKLLGISILPNGVVTVDKKLRMKVESLIYYYQTDSLKFLTMVDNDLQKGAQKISGYLNFINCIDEAYVEKLKRKYGPAVIESFIKQEIFEPPPN